jgi:hypothetical protein
MLAEGDGPVVLVPQLSARSANWLVGFEVRPSGMESGQQQHIETKVNTLVTSEK